MEKFYTKIIGLPVVEEDHIRPITTVKDLVIDPERGKVLAFVVNIAKSLIITPMDVLSWHDVIQIQGSEAIVNMEDVLRVQVVEKSGIKIFNNKVETKDGKYLGKVIDFSVDVHTMDLKRLVVAKGFLGLLKYESRIIPAKNIIEILQDKIVVKGDLATVKEEAKEKVTMEDMALT